MKIRAWHWVACMAVALATGCAGIKEYNLPPAQQLLEPGPGVGGPGPGVIPPVEQPMAPVVGMGGGSMPATEPTAQIWFHKQEGMQVRWDVGGVGQFDSTPLVVPGRQNFPQGGIYRLKLTNIVGREGVELYPTIEVATSTSRSEPFLAHNAIPVQFTDEDFDQVLTGNFVTKVIYLPDPEFQELALAGVETLVSTRLDPGTDPIVEADRRGSILAVIRMGNKDVELPGSNDDGLRLMGMQGGAEAGFAAAACGPGGMPPSLPNYVSGVTTAQYGMPMSGTPIGLPGPPHIPLGSPAGLQKHVMRNHTPVYMPPPTRKVKLHVKQQPGFSYPAPASRAWIREQSIHANQMNGVPRYQTHEHVH
ncbi:MAG: hypothetical protein RLY70_840 [Planctomycetota bacterium]|jgi:hypothetical protein